MPSKVYLSVDRDKLTGGIQISIGEGNGGYRIAGPKYSGASEELKVHFLTKRDADEIRSYLDRIVATGSEQRTRRKSCVSCGNNWADPPSRFCPGCEAYREHQA